MNSSVLWVGRSCSLLIHLIATASLRIVYTKQQECHKDQLLLILNLSAAGMLLDVMDICRMQILPAILTYKATALHQQSNIEIYQLIVREAVSGCVYYATLGAITIHRFVKLKLNFKYPLYCTKQTIWVIIGILWVTALTTTTALCFIHSKLGIFKRFTFEPMFYRYVYTPLNLSLVVAFIVTYSYIMTRQVHSQRRMSDTSTKRVHPLRNPRSYIPLFLGTSFIAFAMVPDLYLTFSSIARGSTTAANGSTFDSDNSYYVSVWKRLFVADQALLSTKSPIYATESSDRLERFFKGDKATIAYICNIMLRMNYSLVYIFMNRKVRMCITNSLNRMVNKIISTWVNFRRVVLKRHDKVRQDSSVGLNHHVPAMLTLSSVSSDTP